MSTQQSSPGSAISRGAKSAAEKDADEPPRRVGNPVKQRKVAEEPKTQPVDVITKDDTDSTRNLSITGTIGKKCLDATVQN